MCSGCHPALSPPQGRSRDPRLWLSGRKPESGALHPPTVLSRHPVSDLGGPFAFSLPGEVGFLVEDRRINVAVTRARRHVAIICDTRTVSSHGFLQRLVAYFSQHGEVRTAFEYLDSLVPENYSHESQGERRQGTKPPEARLAAGRKPKAAAAAKAAPRKRETPFSPSTSGPGGESQRTKDATNTFKSTLLAFLESSEAQLDFPPSLSSHDRMLVHLLAEEHGLQHGSSGEGKERYITVRKKEPGQPPAPSAATPSLQRPLPQLQEPPGEAPAPVETGGSSKGSGKVDLKSLHLERVQREKARREEMARKLQEPGAGLQGGSKKKDKSEAKGRSLLHNQHH